jgi:hypothetical protein
MAQLTRQPRRRTQVHALGGSAMLDASTADARRTQQGSQQPKRRRRNHDDDHGDAL